MGYVGGEGEFFVRGMELSMINRARGLRVSSLGDAVSISLVDERKEKLSHLPHQSLIYANARDHPRGGLIYEDRDRRVTATRFTYKSLLL